MKLYYFYFAVFFYGQAEIQAQSIVINGTITDTNHQPLIGASVKIPDDRNNLIKYFAISNQNGSFHLTLPATIKQFSIVVSLTGYETYMQTCVNNGKNAFMQISLKTFTAQLPAVHVRSTAAFVKHGDTTIYSVGMFAKGNENNFGDLLMKFPGVSVDENGRISFNGKSVTRILLEGDDLMGSNYSTFTNNTGINGMEKISFIENYHDQSRIENSKLNANETVLDIGYQKKRVRIFGDVTGTGAPSSAYYECKTADIGLLKKQKFIVNANRNTTGMLATNLSGMNTGIQFSSEDQGQLPIGIVTNHSPVDIADIKPMNIQDDRYFSNSSTLFTINHLYKPNKKISINSFAREISDDYTQQDSSIETINDLVQQVVIHQNNETIKNNTAFSYGTLINWQPNPEFQTILQYSSNTIRSAQNTYGNIDSLSTNQFNNIKTIQQHINCIITKGMGRAGFLSMQLVYQHTGLNNSYHVINPILDTSFITAGSYGNLLQNFSMPNNILQVQLRYQYNGKLSNYIISGTSSRESSNPDNSVVLFNRPDSLEKLSDFDLSVGLFRMHRNAFSFNMTRSFNSKLKASIKLSLMHCQITTADSVRSIAYTANHVFILPEFTMQYVINRSQQVFAGAQMMPEIPGFSQVNDRFIYTGLTTVTKGINQFNFSTSYLFHISYMYLDLVHSGILFHIMYMMNNRKPGYINDLSVRGLLQLNETIADSRSNPVHILTGRLEKNLAKFRSWLVFTSSLTLGSQYTNNNGQLSDNRYTSMHIELKIQTHWDKWFNMNAGYILRNNQQRSFSNQLSYSNFSSENMIQRTGITIKASKQLLLDIQNDYMISHSGQIISKTLDFADLQCRYFASRKLTLGIKLKNIFHQNSFIDTEISPFQNKVYQYTLLPSIWLMTMQYKF